MIAEKKLNTKKGKERTAKQLQQKRLTVLISGGYSMLVNIEKSFLENAGFIVKVANTVTEMLSSVRNESIDVVLLDYQFESGDGLQKISRAKELAGSSNTKFIVTSVIGSADFKQRAFRMQADAFLTKPLPKDELIKEIKKVGNVSYRKHERIFFDLNISLKYNNETYLLRAVDISLTGMRVFDENKEIHPIVGENIVVEFVIPNSEDKLILNGNIIRITDGGFGIRFSVLKKEYKDILKKFIVENKIEDKSGMYYL